PAAGPLGRDVAVPSTAPSCSGDPVGRDQFHRPCAMEDLYSSRDDAPRRWRCQGTERVPPEVCRTIGGASAEALVRYAESIRTRAPCTDPNQREFDGDRSVVDFTYTHIGI